MHVFGKDIEAVLIVGGTVIVIVLLWLLYAKLWLRNYEKKNAAVANREAETPAKGATRPRDTQHYTDTGSWPVRAVARTRDPNKEARRDERACAAADVRAKITSLLRHSQGDPV